MNVGKTPLMAFQNSDFIRKPHRTVTHANEELVFFPITELHKNLKNFEGFPLQPDSQAFTAIPSSCMDLLIIESHIVSDIRASILV